MCYAISALCLLYAIRFCFFVIVVVVLSKKSIIADFCPSIFSALMPTGAKCATGDMAKRLDKQNSTLQCNIIGKRKSENARDREKATHYGYHLHH